MKIEVRCCCQPKKLLGWIDVDPRAVRRGAVIHFAIPPSAMLLSGKPEIVNTPPVDVTLPVEAIGEYLDDQPVTHLALKSEETPIEVLRRIPGFVESNHHG